MPVTPQRLTCPLRRAAENEPLGTPSRTSFVDHRLPDAFGFKNEFNRFADGTVASEGFRCVVRSAFHFRNRITYGDSEAGAAHQGNIGKVIADVSHSRIGDARFLQDFFVGGHFHRLFHIDEFHFHFVGTPQERSTFATGNTPRTQAGGLRKG